MGFLDGEPDLSNIQFGVEDLARAREVLLATITRLDPAWLDTPVGPLALRWNIDGPYSAAYLIHVARVLYVVGRNQTEKSSRVFEGKVRSLLRPPSAEGAYEELFSELEFAALLAERASPISFEPLVPAGAEDDAAKPKSPDYAVRLPDGDVFFEVTNVHFGFLDDWDATARDTADAISKFVVKRALRRSVTFQAPVSISREQLRSAISSDVLDAIASRESGQAKIKHSAGRITVAWSTVPHFEVDADGLPIVPKDTAFPLAAATFGGTPSPTVSVEHMPLVDGDTVEEAVVRSIRNSLRTKRKQLTTDLEYVLVVRLAHHRIAPDGVSRIIHTRLFPNPDYRWLTGIVLFTPARNWETNEPPPSMYLHINGRARRPASNSLVDLFNGAQRFHL